MRIESMDAPVVTGSKTQDTKTTTKDNTSESLNIIETKSISQLTSQDIMELPISEKVVINMIEKANKAISGANTKFEFSIHEKTKEIMIKVIDSDTNKVIREIPPERTLDLVAKMWEMAGIIVDERR